MTRQTSIICGLAILAIAALTIGGSPSIAGSSARAFRHDDESFAVTAKRIYLLYNDVDAPDGVLRDGWMEIRDGKISRIGKGKPPSWLDVVDFGDASIVPGLVSVSSLPSSVGPRVRDFGAGYASADNFDPYADHSPLWSNGITTARLEVPTKKFVGGVGSVVRLGADGESARVLSRYGDLSVAFDDDGGRNAPNFGDVTYPSSGDIPYTPGVPVRPQGRLGRIQALDALLAGARAQVENLAKSWTTRAADDRRLLSVGAFLATNRPLRIRADRAADIAQAVEAGRRLKVPFYIAGGAEADQVADLLAADRITVAYEVDNNLTSLAGVKLDQVSPIVRRAETVATLLSKGVPVVLDGVTDDLLLAASLVVGGGVDEVTALKSLTQRAADLLGVGAETGTLTVGKDADFVVTNGAPLASGSFVQETWVQGKRAWSRTPHVHGKKSDESSYGETIVVRAGTIHDGTGRAIENGEVLIDNGRVVAVGLSVPHPKNARVVDAGPRAVVTPGFIDVNSTLGIGQDRTRPGPEVALADAYAIARPEFDMLAKAGVTTVVAGPRDADMNGTPMVALKTQGDNRAELIARKTAAVKIALPRANQGLDAMLDGQLKRAKAYWESWKKYDEDYAKWKSGGEVAAAPAAKAPEQPTTPGEKPKDDPISGTWQITLTSDQFPEPEKGSLKLRLNDDNTITGTASSPMGGDGEDVPVSGKLDGKKVTLTLEVEDFPIPGGLKMTLDLDGPDHMAGEIDLMGMIKIKVDGMRTEKGAPTIKITKSKKTENTAGPKKPKVEPALEPYRAVFDGKAGIVVVASTLPQLRAALKVLPTFNLPVTCLGGDDADLLGDEASGKLGVVLGTNLYRSDRTGKKIVLFPDILDRAGISYAVASGGDVQAAGFARLLTGAVRDGLSAESALSSVTKGAAKMLRIDDTVGSLERGRDGDLLIWSGDPFDPRSQLTSVFIRGKEVR